MLYKEVLIETTEQAMSLPRSTPYTVVALESEEVIYAGLVGDRQPEFLVSVADGPQRFALVPIAARYQEGRHEVLPEVERAPSLSAHRYVTPWTEEDA